MRVLIVEDEEKMLQLLRDGLREHGHTVMTASDGQDGLELAESHQFDVVVLDILLPKLNGFEVAKCLRRVENPAAILMLTACDSEDQIVRGLESGADDYLTKPFSFRELLARIKSVTRSVPEFRSSALCVDTLTFDCSLREAFRGGKSLGLTRTELTILECLMRSAGNPVSRSDLIKAVWGEDRKVGNSTLDAFINLLRNKVDVPFERKLVHTVKGVGYGLWLNADCESVLSGKHA